jgi:hypothetical protein
MPALVHRRRPQGAQQACYRGGGQPAAALEHACNSRSSRSRTLSGLEECVQMWQGGNTSCWAARLVSHLHHLDILSAATTQLWTNL